MNLLLLIFSAGAIFWFFSSMINKSVQGSLSHRVYRFITNELHFQTHPSTIEYWLIVRYNLTPKQAADCIENYGNGIEWFEENIFG